MKKQTSISRVGHAVGALALVAASAATAFASDITGTVSFEGDVAFLSPIAGITLDDIVVTTGPGIEATGNGEHCTIDVVGSGGADGLGAYPESGTVTATITIGRGGMSAPDGNCLVQLTAGGNDGANVSAHGVTTVEVTLADIQGNATVTAGTITLRQSKTQAGLTKDCLKWVKKEIKFKGKCNSQLWKLGGTEGSLKCKNAGLEPVDCDPAGYVDEVVSRSYGVMDQQTPDPTLAQAIDLAVLGDEAKCQSFIGKAAANFVAKRNQLVQKNCVDAVADTTSCRSQASTDAKSKLTLIDNCAVNTQATDLLSGLTVADIGEPCLTDCVTAGVIDRKCLKDCFELELGAMSDGVMGDVPVCGNGVVQGGEACDDGNLVSGDCCSNVCGNELGSPETGPACTDLADNDCDELIDALDPDCMP